MMGLKIGSINLLECLTIILLGFDWKFLKKIILFRGAKVKGDYLSLRTLRVARSGSKPRPEVFRYSTFLT